MLQEFQSFYNSLNIDSSAVYFMMAVSAVVAFFHTFIFAGLYGWNYKPKWLFFALNPLIIFGAAQLDVRFGALAMIFIFVSVFPLAFFGMIFAAIRNGLQDFKKKDDHLIKQGKPPIPLYKKVLSAFSVVLFIFLFYSGNFMYLVFFFFILLPFFASLRGSNRKSFYNLQRSLPTSKIRSVAMGLAEISGKVKKIKMMQSHIKKKPCIGYLYTIENVSRDKDGKESFSIEFSETICEAFYVEDATGKITVATDRIEFIDFEISELYQSSGKRYTEYLLLENAEVLLIGKANVTAGNTPTFTYEDIKQVFGIAPLESVNSWNKIRPLLKSASYFLYFFGLCVAMVFITDVQLNRNSLKIGKFTLHLPYSSAPSRMEETSNDDESAAQFAEPVESN